MRINAYDAPLHPTSKIAFSGCTRLENVSVDSRNTHFYAENGMIYSRDTASPVGSEPQADIR